MSLAEERKQLDAAWAQLNAEKAEFQADRKASGLGEIKLFVGNLDTSTTDDALRPVFDAFGTVAEVVILRDPQGQSKRSAFVKYYTKAHADAAIAALHEKKTDGNSSQPMVVRVARPRQPRPDFQQQQSYGFGAQPSYQPQAYGYGGQQDSSYSPARSRMSTGPDGANLYINNIPPGSGENEIRAMFNDFGTILSCKVFSDNGYGFVSFDSTQSAQSAIQCMNGMTTETSIRPMEVSVKKAKRYNPY